MSRQLGYDFWEEYKEHLTTITTHETANDRISYAKKYYSILYSGNASILLTLSSDKRIHAMKSISSLSKYMGCYNLWKQIIEKYQLKWSTEKGLDSFHEIWNSKTNYSSMICWVKQSYMKLPREIGNMLVYCTLTGLRPDEACKSVQLIHTDIDNYLNKQTMTLEHYRFPNLFIRRTKNAYVSIASEHLLELAQEAGNNSYDSVRRIVRKNDIEMRMSYCRKIFATCLRANKIETETIDLLQGRIPKSIFVRHYYRPDSNNDRIRHILETLLETITT